MTDEPTIHAEMSDALDRVIVDALKNGISRLDKDGDVVQVSAPASFLSVARQRLKDLGIDRDLDDVGLAPALEAVLPDHIPDVSDDADAAVA